MKKKQHIIISVSAVIGRRQEVGLSSAYRTSNFARQFFPSHTQWRSFIITFGCRDRTPTESYLVHPVCETDKKKNIYDFQNKFVQLHFTEKQTRVHLTRSLHVPYAYHTCAHVILSLLLIIIITKKKKHTLVINLSAIRFVIGNSVMSTKVQHDQYTRLRRLRVFEINKWRPKKQ